MVHCCSAPLTKYISFARHRLTRAAMASLLPEVFPEIDHFYEGTLHLWNQEMIAYNAAAIRSPPLKKKHEHRITDQCFSNLVDFVQHMHGEKILLALEQLVKFGERVVPLIHEDETARAWYLNEHILIQAHHWNTLAGQVMNLVKQLDLLVAEGAKTSQSNSWLDDIKLLNGWRRAAEIYKGYAAIPHDDFNPERTKSSPSKGGAPVMMIERQAGLICGGHEESSGASSEPRYFLAATSDKTKTYKRSKPNPAADHHSVLSVAEAGITNQADRRGDLAAVSPIDRTQPSPITLS